MVCHKSQNAVEVLRYVTDLLGWKAMPFALEDLDSNCIQVSGSLNWPTGEGHTFVSMLGEDAMVAVGGIRAQSAYTRTEAQYPFMGHKGQPATFESQRWERTYWYTHTLDTVVRRGMTGRSLVGFLRSQARIHEALPCLPQVAHFVPDS